MSFVAGATSIAARYSARAAARFAARSAVRRLGSTARYRWVTSRGLENVPARVVRSSDQFTARQFAAARSSARAIKRDLGVGSVVAGVAGGVYKMLGYKRRRDGSAVKMQQGVGSAIVKRSVKLGKKIPYSRKMVRLQRAAEKSTVLNFRGITTMSGATGTNIGYFPLYRGAAVGFDGVQVLPVHCYNLTAIPNEPGNINSDGIPPSTNFRLSHYVPFVLTIDSAGTMRWAAGFRGQTNSATLTHNWMVENQTNTQSVGGNWPYIAPGKHSYLDWVSAKFMVYGKKKDDTKMRIQLVQFTRDEFCPEYESSEGALNNELGDRLNDVASSYVRPLINNPIVHRLKRGKNEKFFKVLYNKYISIAPKDNDDQNADPAKLQFNVFKRMNRLIDHSDAQNVVLGEQRTSLANLTDESKIDPGLANYRAQPRVLRSNVYLLVSAWDPRTTDVPTSDYQCSYDLNLRKKVSYE